MSLSVVSPDGPAVAPRRASHSSAHAGQATPLMHGVAGVLGGSLSTAVFYPLDLLRTRMHICEQGAALPLTSARAIVRQEGISGMYRGVSVAVLSHSVGWGMYLTVFRSVQNRIGDVMDRDGFRGLRRSLGRGESHLERSDAAIAWSAKGPGHAKPPTGSPLVDFSAACVAAVTTASIITPINLVKTRRQLGKTPHDPAYRGLVGGLRHIMETEGVMTLLRGVGPQILLTGNTTVQVTLYESIKRYMLKGSSPPRPAQDLEDLPAARELSVPQVAFASAVSKAIASGICNPLEVVRTRLQDKSNRARPEYKSTCTALCTIWRSEGMAGLYRGLPVNICRVIPTTVLAFLLYEKSLQLFMAATHVRVTHHRGGHTAGGQSTATSPSPAASAYRTTTNGPADTLAKSQYQQ